MQMTDLKSAETASPAHKSGHSPGPWQMATSCSFRRILDAHGREIIGGAVQRSDNHPDLYFANGGYEGPDAALILAAPELFTALECLLEHYTQLVNCGDCGNWDPKTEQPVVDAFAALSRARGDV
jgi:hypothetical protein